MKKFFGLLCALSLFLSVPGCGGSGEPSSVMDDAEQTAVQEYEALIEAQAAEMDAAPPSDQLEAPTPLPVNPTK